MSSTLLNQMLRNRQTTYNFHFTTSTGALQWFLPGILQKYTSAKQSSLPVVVMANLTNLKNLNI